MFGLGLRDVAILGKVYGHKLAGGADFGRMHASWQRESHKTGTPQLSLWVYWLRANLCPFRSV